MAAKNYNFQVMIDLENSEEKELTDFLGLKNKKIVRKSFLEALDPYAKKQAR